MLSSFFAYKNENFPRTENRRRVIIFLEIKYIFSIEEKRFRYGVRNQRIAFLHKKHNII